MRVLAIDDNADNLVALEALLRAYLPGCQTATARNGPEGLEQASRFQPDVVLLDIQMPGMDGFEVCQALKASGVTRHIPVVFLTAQGSAPATRIRALEAGGDAFLSKPVEPGELMAQVRAMARIKQAEEALRGENRSLEQAVGDRTRALLESRALLATIVDGTPDAIWVKDREGRVLLANTAALRALGRQAEEVLGRSTAELLGPREAAQHEAADLRVLESGETTTQEEQHLSQGRSRTTVATRGPVRDAQGQVTGLFTVVRDITDRALARQVLQRETERVKALLALYREPGQSIDDVVQMAVEGLAALTGSEVGLVGRPVDGSAQLVAQAWSARPSEPTGTRWASRALGLDRNGPWWSALHSGRPVIRNGALLVGTSPLPEGFPALRCLLVVPVIRDGKVVLIGGVANRAEGYSEVDVGQAGLYLEGVWEAIRRIQSLERRTALEAQLMQAAKMEAVGRLAGGVAHDFNNLLVVILSYTRMVMEVVGESSPLLRDLREVLQAGERAAALTRQLLAHSRKQVLQASPLDLNQVITGVEPMLRRLLGEDLELQLHLGDAPWVVTADRGQLEQVIVNLAVNARDAMPQGGRVTLRTSNLPAGADPGGGPWDSPGVLLEVSDTGVGMDEPTRAQVFEPFFTTKEQGKGTGLGLATVYGIVKQSGGDIRVESTPGAGTVFRVLLPRSAEAETAPVARAELLQANGVAPAGGQETILVAEDEAAVRGLAERLLTQAGYRVLAAKNGEEALARFATAGESVSLLLTDVVMPRMSGRELASRLTASSPGLKVVYMSGYLDDVLGKNGLLSPDIKFIGKPFRDDELLRLVRRVLDGASEPPAIQLPGSGRLGA